MYNKTKDYILGFALNYNPEYESYIPIANIVEVENNKLKHVVKQANEDTLTGMNFDVLPKDYDYLLQLCAAFSKELLIKKFKISSQKTFATVLKDKQLSIAFKKYLNQKLNDFLKKINELNAPLTIDFRREDWFDKNQLKYSNTILEPILNFEKQENQSIEYTLKLEIDQQIISPKSKNIKIFAPDLNWVVISNVLFPINGLNSNKLKPFLEKDTVTISANIVNVFFEKFVKDVSNLVNIQANGFDFQHFNKINKCTIQLVDHFVTNSFFVEMLFEYQNITIKSTDKKTTFSKIGFDQNNQVYIEKTTRNQIEEENYIQKLINFGFSKNDFNYFERTTNKKNISLIEYIIQNYQELKNEGIEPKLLLNYKKITEVIPTYQLEKTQKNDWFDVKIMIFCGEFSFPFTKLISNLQKKERFYLLPDDSFFLIPEEWFTEFEVLINQSQIVGEEIRLPKSNFTILKKIIPERKIIEFEENKELNLNKLQAQLRPYQLQGAKWLENHCSNQFGACLADDMGLGKTLQVIALLVHFKTLKEYEKPVAFSLFDTEESKQKPLNALVVLPNSLVFNWANEIKKFAPHLSVIQYVGNDRKKIAPLLAQYDIVLSTYGLILKELETLKKIDFQFLILDESHRIKNVNSKIFTSISDFDIPFKISLSGTPVENSLSELWTQMQFINPNILGSYKYFKQQYIEPITKKQDQKVLENLKDIISPFILRRTKTQVAPELPQLIEQIHYCEMLEEQDKLYQTEISKARNSLLKVDKVNKINVFNTLLLLRQISNHPKMIDQNIESGKAIEVKNHLEMLLKANQKVLIFSSFVQHLSIYTQWCNENNYKYTLLTGKNSLQERKISIEKFISDDTIPFFFISKKAGGEGLNLTVANYIVLLDPWWNPFVEAQAIARSHRIGQDNNVMVTRFITIKSIEEKIMLLQAKKQDLFNQLIQENDIPDGILNHLEEILID
ncbi:MAG: DEAD/DEAH box helicase [Flavobacterium sp.]